MSSIGGATDTGWIDVSLPIATDLLTWPGNPPVELAPEPADRLGRRRERQRAAHRDPFRHTCRSSGALRRGGAGIDRVPLDVLIGPCWVADVTGRGGALGADDLDALDVPAGTERLLLRTDNSELWRSMPAAFPESYVSVGADGARWLVDRGSRLVGIDFLGIEAPGSEGIPRT